MSTPTPTPTPVAESESAEPAVEMAPWEQHAAVISIPRYDYRAPSSLLDASHSGFLITCPIKREKSATKEAISILSKFMKKGEEVESDELGVHHNGDESVMGREELNKLCNRGKKRKFSPLKNQDCIANEEVNEVSDEIEDSEILGSDSVVDEYRPLSLIKLTGSGLVLFTFRESNRHEPAKILTSILAHLQSGELKSLQWCHRMLPVQATCRFEENELQIVVSKLVQQYLKNEWHKPSTPLKFAVGYNRRGVNDVEKITQKQCLKDSENVAPLDRNKVFAIVGSTVKSLAVDSIVDLKSPEVVVFVELLPLSGLVQGSLVAAVSVLPHDLVTVKPRLCVKALFSDSKVPKVKCAS